MFKKKFKKKTEKWKLKRGRNRNNITCRANNTSQKQIKLKKKYGIGKLLYYIK